MLEKTSLDVFQQQMKCIKKNREFLSSLSSTYKLGLISNFTANLPIILQETKLDTLFDATLISKVDDLKKPLKAAFYLLTDRLQVKPKNCAMVGDSYKNDIVPAKSLGMTTYWLGSDDCVKTEESDAADYRITRLEDLN